MKSRRGTGLAAVLAGTLALAACEGANWFTGPGTGGDNSAPIVVAVVVPDFVRPGELLEIEIEAEGSQGITAVDVTLVEAVTRERTLSFDPPQPSVNTVAEFRLPTPLARPSVLVQVQAQDRLGGQSQRFEVEIPVQQDGDSF